MTMEEIKEYTELINNTCNKLDHKNLCNSNCSKCTLFKALMIIVNDGNNEEEN